MLGFFIDFPFLISSLALGLTLFTSSGVFVIFVIFLSFQLVRSQVLATSPAGGGHDRLFLLVFAFIFFLFLFRFVFFVFVFSLIVSFRFSIS